MHMSGQIVDWSQVTPPLNGIVMASYGCLGNRNCQVGEMLDHGSVEANGCCFRFGYGAGEIPCCLQVENLSFCTADSLPWYVHGDQVNKGLSKEKCHAQLRQNSLGGEMGWRYGQSQVWYLLQFLGIGCWDMLSIPRYFMWSHASI